MSEQHPFTPGMRANFATSEQIQAALEDGYFELSGLFANGQASCRLILKAERGVKHTYRICGERADRQPAIYQNVSQLLSSLDIHAFRWYPFTPSKG